jgi:hypothetical protein
VKDTIPLALTLPEPDWCRRRDLNPHAPKGTSPSSWKRPVDARCKRAGHTLFLLANIPLRFDLGATWALRPQLSHRESHEVDRSWRSQ